MLRNILILLCVGLLVACGDSFTENVIPPDEMDTFNPFDTITYPDEMVPDIEVDSTSFLGLHTYIFSRSCNQPACHDGTFEPDFRTVQSAYNTLVLHPPKKNFASNPLPYRVMPGNPQESMMYRRITEHNPPNFEQMPSSGIPLEDHLIANVKTWIENGAKDIYDRDPMQSSVQPTSFGLVAFNEAEDRIDTNRGGNNFNPFQVTQQDGVITAWFFYLDVTPAQDTVYGNTLEYNKIQFSNNPVDFSEAKEFDLEKVLFPLLEDSVFSIPLGFNLPFYHKIEIDPYSLGFSPGEVIYMRTYVQDSDHDEPTEIPESDSQFALQTYFAFLLM